MARRLLTLGLLATLVLGCSGGGNLAQIHGKLTKGGQILPVSGREVGIGFVQVQFFLLNEKGEPTGEVAGASFREDGITYNIPGNKGNGIPPGKYRISIQQWDPYPNVDRLNGKFDPEHTPIVREFVQGSQELNIDLDQL
jgi:hypothetical protein